MLQSFTQLTVHATIVVVAAVLQRLFQPRTYQECQEKNPSNRNWYRLTGKDTLEFH